ncbi:hypothetical protein PCL_04656 [Purpureocillium lilacinum]|uniref:Uncharacterized protein n=1 Tax=Purpureocillium lilacinum TaxID=33203 RepID=A0A2U3DX52_PURLI|nr:hypothetical protein PCL_04656 [Purpureocillium lilacinum]
MAGRPLQIDTDSMRSSNAMRGLGGARGVGDGWPDEGLTDLIWGQASPVRWTAEDPLSSETPPARPCGPTPIMAGTAGDAARTPPFSPSGCRMTFGASLDTRSTGQGNATVQMWVVVPTATVPVPKACACLSAGRVGGDEEHGSRDEPLARDAPAATNSSPAIRHAATQGWRT